MNAPDRLRPRILIVRLSAVGDTIHTLPVAAALRERFPQAFLAWAVEPKASALLEGSEAIDELVVLPRGFLTSPKRLWAIRSRLRAMRFDTAIDVQGLTKSAAVAWISGARRRIGFARPSGREISPWLNNELVTPTAAHVVDQYLELLRPLGIQRPTARFQVPETPAEAHEAESTIAQFGLDGGFATINSGAGWPSKRWPAERFASVARHLGEFWRLPSMVVWSGIEERGWAEEIVAGSRGNARLAPATSLRGLAALARRSRLFLSSDTGPLHLAAAVGTPCVGLFGPWPAERNGPYGPRNVAIQRMRLDGSTRDRRSAPSIYMESIDVPSVCEACDQVLCREHVQAA